MRIFYRKNGGQNQMAVAISLRSETSGEIKRFLDTYFGKETNIDEDVGWWVYVYNRPLDAVDIVSAVMDNCDKYQISVCLQIDKCSVYPVTADNYNDVIKGMFDLYYEEQPEAVY